MPDAARMTALLAATHNDAHGNAVVTDATHDTITIQQRHHGTIAGAPERLSFRLMSHTNINST
jgi:hypothetical protein